MPKLTSCKHLFGSSRLSEVHMITVFGSINIDLTFQLPALPSVGETMLTPAFTEAVGGKGANQAVAARRDGADTCFIGCIGRDEFGERAKTALQREGINVEALARVPGKTGLASIWIDEQGDNMIAVASGANSLLTSEAVLPSALTSETLVVLQMEVPRAETERVITRAKQNDAKVLLNLAPALPLSSTALEQVDILVLNELEARTLCEQFSFVATAAEADVQRISEKLDASVIITLGSAGVVAAHEGEIYQAEALPVTPVDTTGAGDCIVGVLASGLDAGLNFDRALQRAAVAGSLACTIVGTLPSFPSRHQIDEAVGQVVGSTDNV